MPIKLQVVKEGDDAEPADYLFEQEEIYIGRGSDNDLTLPDQKVSTQHALIVNEDGQHLLTDQDSKNHTYVNSERVGEDEPYVLRSGDVFQVGDFKIEFVPLFMPSSEQTAYADSDEEGGNPFEKHAAQFADALSGLAETYTYAPSDRRDDAFAEAFEGRFGDDLEGHQVVDRIFRMIGQGTGDGAQSPPSSTATPPAGAEPSADRPVDAEGEADGEASSMFPSVEGDAERGAPGDRDRKSPPVSELPVDDVLDTLLESIARMISIPTHFWREFSGNTVVHPPEQASIHRASVDGLREHLLDADLDGEEREERLEHLRKAVQTLVAHNVAMLAGYKKAVMAGSKDLLQQVNPIDAIEAAEDADGGMLGSIFGGDERPKTELDALEKRWNDLFHGEWGALEKELFRPTYVETYLDRMAKAWGVDKEDITERK